MKRWSADALFDLCPADELAERLGVHPRTVSRWRGLLLDDMRADRWATALGLHPANVWPDWGDPEIIGRTCDQCGAAFFPYQTTNRFCSGPCRWTWRNEARREHRAKLERQRYRASEAKRVRRRETAKAYYETYVKGRIG